MRKRSRNLFIGAGLVSCLTLAVSSGLFASSKTGDETETVASPWGEDYFPNVELIDHTGKSVRFFDDLIKDKVVMINFIYTSCPDSCPLETARLAEVASILGDRVGNDVFIYSISIDPETDTPEVLAKYRERYQAPEGWSFFTGNEADIISLRQKLGLYIPEIQSEDSNDHNLSLIIGNQKTGRWMKRSPFENSHVLAEHVGSWLHDWKLPSNADRDFSKAPKLRSLSDGERLFRTRCAACHTIAGEVVGGAVTDAKNMGPDLYNVHTRRERPWLLRWISEPDKMLAEKDPIAMGLFKQFNNIAMPNMRLDGEDVVALVEFLQHESGRFDLQQASEQSRDGLTARLPWIREPHPEAETNAGYLSLENTTTAKRVLTGITSPAYGSVEIHEMYTENGERNMRQIHSLELLPSKTLVLKPGGMHLMLMEPVEALVQGDMVNFTLIFDAGTPWNISVPVRKAEPGSQAPAK